ncbi:MAG: hypothetical protein AB2693_34005, partial [Candidatus Thiodiazotropha sp.]
ANTVLCAVSAQDPNMVTAFLKELKSSPEWDPSNLILNLCVQLSETALPEIYNLLIEAGVRYSSKTLLAAAIHNGTTAMMKTIDALMESLNWEPETDLNISRALEIVCRHNNMLMYNIMQKKGARLTINGIFNIIENCKSLFYSIGPEYRKEVKDVPSLAAMTIASLSRKVLIPATRQKATLVYWRIIHALEETGKLDRNDPLLQDALQAAVDSGSVSAYNTMADTGTEVSEIVVLQMLQAVDKPIKVEVPERLLCRVFRICVIQCIIGSIMKGNISVLEKTAVLMKQNMLCCPNDRRILNAVTMSKSANKAEIIKKLLQLNVFRY